MTRGILLINSNITWPPVSPVGLEYVGEALVEADVPVQVLDLAFETDWKAALRQSLKYDEPVVVGLTVRNTDDCCFASRKSFLPWLREVVKEVKKYASVPVFLGGVGFSTLPETVLRFTEADGGIVGDGEEAVVALVNSLIKGEYGTRLPNMVYPLNNNVIHNPRSDIDLKRLPVPRRRLFDNKRYQKYGAMVGIETKRGCAQKCIYCADPIAKGAKVRLRPAEVVVQEVRDLLEQGVSWFHLCDSEFNLPLEHAKDVCRSVIENGLGDRIRWYCYCAPVPFDSELAHLMKGAGCGGINFGVDSLCDEQLQRLGRTHSTNDIQQLVHLLKKEGLNYIFDLLIGGPGENVETVRTTINRVSEFGVSLAGIATGVRVYPGTPLGRTIDRGIIKEGLYPETNESPEQPVFYISPSLGDNAVSLVHDLAGGDKRFLLLSAPGEEGSYNYAGDELLSRLIEQGARGAYWDILRQHLYGNI